MVVYVPICAEIIEDDLTTVILGVFDSHDGALTAFASGTYFDSAGNERSKHNCLNGSHSVRKATLNKAVYYGIS